MIVNFHIVLIWRTTVGQHVIFYHNDETVERHVYLLFLKMWEQVYCTVEDSGEKNSQVVEAKLTL